MFRIVYGGASKFKYVTQALSKVNDEGYMEFLEDGLRMWLMSPDKTMMGVVFIPSYSFDEFSVEETARITLRVDELHRIVRRAARNDILTLELDVDSQSILATLTDRKIGISRSFTLPVINLSGEEFRELRIQPTARFTMEAKDLKTIVGDAKTIGENIVIEAEEELVRVKVSGEGREYIWELRLGDPLIDLQVEEHTISSYSRTSLEVAAKPAATAENVRMEYATDHPAQISFNLPRGENMIIYIAPILE